MISKQQKKILAFPFTNYDAIICDGAIRSGKTSIMTVAFIDWAMREYSGKRFGICGKTVDSAVKNIIMPFLAMNYAKEKYTLIWRRTDKVLEVSNGTSTNIFEVFGGKDESSFALIQGRTLAGVLLDEVALMPRSFVEQALARCSVDGSKLWFNCNPESPRHWFYLSWIKKAEEKNCLYLHFTMKDNPSLSERIIKRYEGGYEGVFYDRYIKGLWVVAEGLVYSNFGEKNIVDECPESGDYYISVDYGTQNPFSAGLWCVNDGTAYRVKEYYHSGRESNRQLTDSEYYEELERLAGDTPIEWVTVDPSAASFIAEIRKHGKFRVAPAKNDVMDGIRYVSMLLKNDRLKIFRSCTACINEFGLYRWDEKSTVDRVIKENDHAMDDVRYFAYTIMRKLYNE